MEGDSDALPDYFIAADQVTPQGQVIGEPGEGPLAEGAPLLPGDGGQCNGYGYYQWPARRIYNSHSTWQISECRH